MLKNSSLPFSLRGPDKEWRSALAGNGWVHADQSDKGRFSAYVKNLSDCAVDLEDCLALDVGYFDPAKNIGQPDRVAYLSPFIRSINKLEATEHLRGVIVGSNGRPARFAKLAEMLLQALVDREILSCSGDLYSISSVKRRELKDIPANVFLQANDGIVSLEDFTSCGIDPTNSGEIVDSHVVDFEYAGLDEEGLLQLTKQHGGASHNLVSLGALDKWAINDTSILANIFQKALDQNPYSSAKLNEGRDAVNLAPPNKDQLKHLKQTLEGKLKNLTNGVKALQERDTRLKEAIETQQISRNEKEREKDVLIAEGKSAAIRLLAMREARKILGNE
jgi:hypothetical protein